MAEASSNLLVMIIFDMDSILLLMDMNGMPILLRLEATLAMRSREELLLEHMFSLLHIMVNII